MLLTLSPSSTCTETSGYISSSTSYNSRSSPTHKHNSSHNANIDIVNGEYIFIYKVEYNESFGYVGVKSRSRGLCIGNISGYL